MVFGVVPGGGDGHAAELSPTLAAELMRLKLR